MYVVISMTMVVYWFTHECLDSFLYFVIIQSVDAVVIEEVARKINRIRSDDCPSQAYGHITSSAHSAHAQTPIHRWKKSMRYSP